MKCALIGERLGHSFSKEIHLRMGKYDYELVELAPDELEKYLMYGDFDALNVTIPYKEAVIPYLDGIDELAAKIGAVNTIVKKEGRLVGYNTDASGMMLLIKKLVPDLSGKCVLIAGSGGTSKTALQVAADLGASEVKRISRACREEAISYEEAYSAYSHAEVIINTTPVGMYPNNDAAPIDIERFDSLKAVVDAVYNPLRTRLVCSAAEKGIASEGGLYMLVAQAVLSAELFTGTGTDAETIDRIYSELLREKQSIVLIGMPGSGKTTLGRMLADEQGREFIDTDEEIVKEAGMPISEIFSEYGEQYFRDMESRVIERLSSAGGRVIATGGGAVLRKDNINSLKQNGILVFLSRSPDELMPTEDRPLADNSEKIRRLYDERMPIYEKAADVTVYVKGYDEQAADEIRSALI